MAVPSRNNSPQNLLRSDLQVIERSYGISLCPKTDFAGIFERIVAGLNLLVAVVIAGDLVAHYLYAQFVPFSRGDFQIGSRELATPTVHHVIEALIVLQSVGADDVVVVWVYQAKNKSCGSVNAARDCLELHAEIQVLKRGFIRNQQGKPVVGLVR